MTLPTGEVYLDLGKILRRARERNVGFDVLAKLCGMGHDEFHAMIRAIRKGEPVTGHQHMVLAHALDVPRWRLIAPRGAERVPWWYIRDSAQQFPGGNTIHYSVYISAVTGFSFSEVAHVDPTGVHDRHVEMIRRIKESKGGCKA